MIFVVKAVFGIGNKGVQYQNTRHNLPWMILDHYVSGLKKPFICEGETFFVESFVNNTVLYLVKFKSFVNIVGSFILGFMHKKQINPENILVISDDIHLPLGRLKMRPKGSAGGHNGLRSVIDSLETSDFPRLRVGIGQSGKVPLVDHVLGTFSKKELKCLRKVLSVSEEAINDFCVLDWQTLMSKYNRFSKNDLHKN